MTGRQVVTLNETTPQLEAPQAGDTYDMPRDVSVTGDIAVSGTVDGRDIAADGGTLDTANQPVLTTKGDLEAFSTVRARLGVGSDAQVLTADSGEALGIKWATAAAGGVTGTYKNATYTAVAGDIVFADSQSPAFTVTLPATPSTDDVVSCYDVGGNAGTNNITIGRNGETLNGAAADFVLDVDWSAIDLVYSGTTWEYSLKGIGSGVNSPLTTKGDLFSYSTTDARLPVGTDTHVLTADAAEALGVKWAAASGGGAFEADADTQITPTTSVVLDAASGVEKCFDLSMTVNQSGTAGYDCDYADVTETATGSGSNYLFRRSVGGVDKFHFDNNGQLTLDPAGAFGNTTGIAFGDGDTGFYEHSDDALRVQCAGVFAATFDQYALTGSASAAAKVLFTATSATAPGHVFSADNDTGIGRAAADQLSLIAGGVEGLRVEEGNNGTVGAHLLINDLTTAPTGNATGGGYLFSEGGALKWRGSSGTVTTIAVA